VLEIHRELGEVMRLHVGMSRSEPGLKEAIAHVKKLRAEFWEGATVTGKADEFNKNLEMAGRVADYLELGELMARDALQRRESCGGHFRTESQTPEGEALRDDERFTFVAAWEYPVSGGEPVMHKEELTFEAVQPSTRSYK
jgi:succinate dehydrogenase / fumarate reductase flavoprotein subunit